MVSDEQNAALPFLGLILSSQVKEWLFPKNVPSPRISLLALQEFLRIMFIFADLQV